MNDEALRYPTGKFVPQETYSQDDVTRCIQLIKTLPSKMEALAKSLSAVQLEVSYREGGWSARQVIHHVADSHMNAYIRFKWTLTEDTPTIKAYNEKRWAETPDATMDPQLSIDLLTTLHAKWVALLSALTPDDLKRAYIHPDTNKHNRLDRIVAMYAWHGEHHLGHLKIISEK